MNMSSSPIELVAGRYQLIEQAGDGTMSRVYKASDIRLGNRVVAVKLLNTLRDDELQKEVFKRETAALELLEHPNIVQIFNYDWSPEYKCYFIVLEYIPRTLLDEIQAHAKNKEDLSWCWPLMRQLADALVQAHGQGVIHRDIKPTNILMTATGTPKLTV